MYSTRTRRTEKTLSKAIFIILAALLLSPTSLLAAPIDTDAAGASKLSMTLTPPIFQLSLAPGATWASELKFVNGNTYDLLVHSSVVNFKSNGENGTAIFSPLSETAGQNAHELGSWITLAEPAKKVTRGTSVTIPFSITIPKDAEPGGHYAAILVGTESTAQKGGGMSVASLISSLLFVRITGDVVEQGNIRDFYPENSLVQTQEATFDLRFENTGNVHLAPQGDIIIYNMFGKNRGHIIVNAENTFGNVLPDSTRKFTFEWKGEHNFFDIGRYKAIATLVYGEDGRKTVFRETYFWVIPWVPFLSIFGSLALFLWFMFTMIRRYIRKAIQMEQIRVGGHTQNNEQPTMNNEKNAKGNMQSNEQQTISNEKNIILPLKTSKSPQLTVAILKSPLVKGVQDLSRTPATTAGKKDLPQESSSAYESWFAEYRMFVIFIVVFVSGSVLIGWYIHQVFEEERGYQMLIKKDGIHDVVVSSGKTVK